MSIMARFIDIAYLKQYSVHINLKILEKFLRIVTFIDLLTQNQTFK